MKKVMVIGVGAQGSTIAKRLEEELNVEEIICADYDVKAAQTLETELSKAKAVRVDANNIAEIVKAAGGCELIVNGLAPEFNMTVMDAALKIKAHYQDLASGPVSGLGFVETVEHQLGRGQEFADAGLAVLINTGSAPGIANILTREACDKFDQVETIWIFVYDGIWSKKFIPFWWSPKTAFEDMAAKPVIFENSEFKRVPPFNNPQMTKFRGLGERLMVDHEHEEPVTMGLLADKYLKGVRNVYFRYGGPGCELAKYFYDMGLLSEEPVEVDGQQVIPMNLISKLTPAAPKYKDEIQAVLDEGMHTEEGAFLVRVEGEKEEKRMTIDTYANGPGLREAFEKAGITHESFFTGQGAFLFTKMLVNNKISMTGVFPPEAFDKEMRAYYMREAKKLHITFDEFIENGSY